MGSGYLTAAVVTLKFVNRQHVHWLARTFVWFAQRGSVIQMQITQLFEHMDAVHQAVQHAIPLKLKLR
jgi:hypothetical protein